MKKKHTKKKAAFRFLFDPDDFRGGVLADRHTQASDPLLWLLVSLLVAFGSVMVFSASYAYALNRYENSYYFIERQVAWVLIGFAVMFGASLLNSRFYRAIARLSYALTVVLLLVVLLIGTIGNGAQRWIAIGPITIQPSEIAKTTLVMMLAWYFATYEQKALDRQNKRRLLVWGTLIPFCFIGLVCVLVMLQKHLSGLIILGAIGLLVMFLSGIGLRYLGYCTAAAGAGVSFLALFTEYTKRRITIWFNPELYPLEGGWQTLQGMMAIGSGGFFGLGLGNSRLKFSYVSEPANDMIFTIVCEELGFLGALLVLVLFALFIWRAYLIGMRHPDIFMRLLVLGIAAKVAIQVLLNVAVVTNTIPNTGISLPFFSYGGSSLVMLFFEMGILLSASRSAHIKR
ncbi:MAG: FtsW/RodA/SpoVE family cell cycle protein [Eubacteriales bacterium]